MITVKNIRHTRDGVYCGRRNTTYKLAASPLANPYHLGEGESRVSAVAKYDAWLQQRLGSDTPQEREIQRLLALALAGDVTLLCWCKDRDADTPECHADAIKTEIERRLV